MIGSYSEKQALISIAAGSQQAPLIKKAKELGYIVVAVDRDVNAPGFAFADECIVVSTHDSDAVVSELSLMSQRHVFAGVVARTTGKALLTASRIASAFDLPGLTVDLVKLATEKSTLRSFCNSRGIPAPVGWLLNPNDDIPSNIPMPVVVKPDYTVVGKAGITLCRNRTDLVSAVQVAATASGNDKVELESYVDGIDTTCLCWAYAGQTHIITWWDELVACDADGRFIGLGVSVPSVIVGTSAEAKAESVIRELVSYFPTVEALLLFSLRVSKDNNIHVLELHADLGGDLIADVLLPNAASQFDYFHLAIDVATSSITSVPPLQLTPTLLYYLPHAVNNSLLNLDIQRGYALSRLSTVAANLENVVALNLALGRRADLTTGHLAWLRCANRLIDNF